MGHRQASLRVLAQSYGLGGYTKSSRGCAWHEAWWRHPDGRPPLYLVTRKDVGGYWIMRFNGGGESYPHGPFKKFKEAAALYIILLEMA